MEPVAAENPAIGCHHEVTSERQNMVKTMVSFGVPSAEIAKTMNLTEGALHALYRNELQIAQTKAGGLPAPVGRPSSYDPAYCQKLEEAMARGLSFTAFAGTIGVARSTLDEWKNHHSEFSDAWARGRARRLQFLEERNLEVLSKGCGPGTAQLLQFNLKNVGGDEWMDRPPDEQQRVDMKDVLAQIGLKILSAPLVEQTPSPIAPQEADIIPFNPGNDEDPRSS